MRQKYNNYLKAARGGVAYKNLLQLAKQAGVELYEPYRHAFNLHTGFETIRPLREGYTFSDKIAPADWPSFCRGILDCQADTVGCDKMMLDAQNNISGLPQHSYNILCCGFASKK